MLPKFNAIAANSVAALKTCHQRYATQGLSSYEKRRGILADCAVIFLISVMSAPSRSDRPTRKKPITYLYLVITRILSLELAWQDIDHTMRAEIKSDDRKPVSHNCSGQFQINHSTA
jgi:hypothetical protein